MASVGDQAYNRGLGEKPPSGSRTEYLVEVRRAKTLEAESLLKTVTKCMLDS